MDISCTMLSATSSIITESFFTRSFYGLTPLRETIEVFESASISESYLNILYSSQSDKANFHIKRHVCICYALEVDAENVISVV